MKALLILAICIFAAETWSKISESDLQIIQSTCEAVAKSTPSNVAGRICVDEGTNTLWGGDAIDQAIYNMCVGVSDSTPGVRAGYVCFDQATSALDISLYQHVQKHCRSIELGLPGTRAGFNCYREAYADILIHL